MAGNWLDFSVVRVAYYKNVQARSVRATHQSEHREGYRGAHGSDPVAHYRELNQVEGEGEASAHYKNVVATKLVEPL